jgi:hypothetical protein
MLLLSKSQQKTSSKLCMWRTFVNKANLINSVLKSEKISHLDTQFIRLVMPGEIIFAYFEKEKTTQIYPINRTI